MAVTKPKPYRSLGGTRGFITTERHALWLGSDHILCVSTSFARETSRRFSLEEIEGISITGSLLGRFLNVLYSAITLAGVAVGALVYLRGGAANEGFGATAIVIGGFGLVALLINLALGQTCITRLYTAVHVEELRPLRRWRRARRFARAVAPRIQDVQGPLNAERAGNLAQDPGTIRLGKFVRETASRVTKPPRMWIHRLLAPLLMVAGALGIANLFAFIDGKVYLDFFLFAAVTLTAIAAGIEQARSRLPAHVRMAPWVTVTLAGLATMLASYAMSFDWAERAGSPQPFSLIDAYRVFSGLVGVVMVIIAALGWLDANRFAEKLRRDAATERAIPTEPTES